MKGTVIDGQTRDLPPGVFTKSGTYRCRSGGSERSGQHNGDAEQDVEFQEDQLGDGYVFARVQRLKEGRCPRMIRVRAFDGGQQDVGVDGNYSRGTPRLS